MLKLNFETQTCHKNNINYHFDFERRNKKSEDWIRLYMPRLLKILSDSIYCWDQTEEIFLLAKNRFDCFDLWQKNKKFKIYRKRIMNNDAISISIYLICMVTQAHPHYYLTIPNERSCYWPVSEFFYRFVIEFIMNLFMRSNSSKWIELFSHFFSPYFKNVESNSDWLWYSTDIFKGLHLPWM